MDNACTGSKPARSSAVHVCSKVQSAARAWPSTSGEVDPSREQMRKGPSFSRQVVVAAALPATNGRSAATAHVCSWSSGVVSRSNS